MGFLSLMVVSPECIRERIATDQAGLDDLLTREIDRFADYCAADPAPDLDEHWHCLRLTHHHGPGDPCNGFCDCQHLLSLGVRETRQALAEIQQYFRDHEPLDLPVGNWAVRKVAETPTTIFGRIIRR